MNVKFGYGVQHIYKIFNSLCKGKMRDELLNHTFQFCHRRNSTIIFKVNHNAVVLHPHDQSYKSTCKFEHKSFID